MRVKIAFFAIALGHAAVEPAGMPDTPIAMPDAPPFLCGPYSPPRFKVGGVLTDATLGRVTVVRVHDAPIPWPMASTGNRHRIILCGDLVNAVRNEAGRTVAYWWGVSATTVTNWRHALGVGRVTPGTFASMASVKRPGRPASDASRRKMAAAKLGTKRPPPWTAEEDAILAAHPHDAAEVARLTGRSVVSVYRRRHVLRRLAND